MVHVSDIPLMKRELQDDDEYHQEMQSLVEDKSIEWKTHVVARRVDSLMIRTFCAAPIQCHFAILIYFAPSNSFAKRNRLEDARA